MTSGVSSTLRRNALSYGVRQIRTIGYVNSLCLPPDPRGFNIAASQANEECTSSSNWTLRKFPEIRNSPTSSVRSGISWKRLASALNSLLPGRHATDSSLHEALLGSTMREGLNAVHAVQGRMLSSLSASRAQIHEEEDQHGESVGDSDAGSGSELEEFEWEDEDAEEPENLEDLQSLEDLEDIEEPTTEPREPRKANGREPSYSMRIEAPIDEIYALLHSRGFITVKQKRPTPNDSVLGQEDYRIVSWYRRVSIGLLNYYSCCDNFLKVKAMVNYQLRWSAIHTLSKKHKSSSRQVIQKYGKNLVVTRDGKTVASFLSVEEIKKHHKGFLEIDPVPPETLIDVLYTRMKRRGLRFGYGIGTLRHLERLQFSNANYRSDGQELYCSGTEGVRIYDSSCLDMASAEQGHSTEPSVFIPYYSTAQVWR